VQAHMLTWFAHVEGQLLLAPESRNLLRQYVLTGRYATSGREGMCQSVEGMCQNIAR
jgi:hypothetical protein